MPVVSPLPKVKNSVENENGRENEIEIELIFLDPLTVTEESITILKHLDYKKILTIENGSGHFTIDWMEKQNIKIEFVNKKLEKKILIVFSYLFDHTGNNQWIFKYMLS